MFLSQVAVPEEEARPSFRWATRLDLGPALAQGRDPDPASGSDDGRFGVRMTLPTSALPQDPGRRSGPGQSDGIVKKNRNMAQSQHRISQLLQSPSLKYPIDHEERTVQHS